MQTTRSLPVIGLVIAIFLVSESGAMAAEPLRFDVTQGLAAGPPYPASTLEFETVTGAPPDPVVPVEIVTLTLEEVCAPPEPCAPVEFDLAATDTGGDIGSFGSEVNVDWSTPPDDTFPAMGLSFASLFEMNPPSAASPAPVMGIVPCVMPSAAGFDLHFETEIPGLGTAEHTAHFEAGPGQALAFANVQVGALQGASFPLSFDLLSTGSVDETEPLFTMTLSGSFSSPAAAPALTPASLVALCLILAVAASITIRRLGEGRLPES